MKNKSHFLACLLILAIIIFAASCGGGGGGGGSVVAFGNNSGPHNGGDAGGWGNGGYNGNGFGGNGGGIGSGDEGEIVITGSTPLNVTKYVYNGTEYSDVKALTTALKASDALPDSFNVDFYVGSEGTPRTARVTANGQANNGQDIFIEHQYKAAFPTGNGGSQDVFFYKRDGITLPGEGGTVTIDGFDFESGWKIDGTFYSPGAKLSVASNGDVDLRSRAVQETSVYGFKTDGAGGYIMGFNSNALQANGNNIVVSSDKQISSIELPSNPVNLDLSQATGFTNVNFGSSNKERLAGITLPNTATAIADGAFLNCSSLSSINLPPSVTTIGDNAFDTSALTAIEIPASVQSIGLGAFNSCDALGTVTFAAGSQLQEIGGNAFFDCSNLSTIELPSTVDTIGQYAFAGCTSLESFTIPNGVTELEGTFFGCSNLASISIPPSVSSIGNSAFNGVKTDCVLTINSTGGQISLDTALPNSDFKVKLTGTGIPINAADSNSLFRNNTNLTSVEIGENITGLQYGAFFGCANLETVTFSPSSTLSTISANAFYRCSISSIELPNGVTTIERDAFSDCSNLASITIPANVTSIGSAAGPSTPFSGTCGSSVSGGCTLIFKGNQTMTTCVLPNADFNVVLQGGVPQYISGGAPESIFKDEPTLKSVVYAGGTNLIPNAFTGCSSLTTVTFKSYPTIIQNSPTSPLPDNVTRIIFEQGDNSPLGIGGSNNSSSNSVDKLFSPTRDYSNLYVTFMNDTSKANITVRAGAFDFAAAVNIHYEFNSFPNAGMTYDAENCFRTGARTTFNSINFTWNASAKEWQ